MNWKRNMRVAFTRECNKVFYQKSWQAEVQAATFDVGQKNHNTATQCRKKYVIIYDKKSFY